MLAGEKTKRKNDDGKLKGRRFSRLGPWKSFYLVVIAAIWMGVFIVLVIESAPEPPPPFPSERLNYTRGQERYVLDLRTESQALVYTQVGGFAPPLRTYSPDGQWTVYWEPDENMIWRLVMQNTASNVTTYLEHTFTPVGFTFNWSKDSSRLVFHATLNHFSENDSELWLLSPEKGGLERLTDNAVEDFSPSLSPTGREMVYVSDAEGEPHLYMMGIETRESHILTPDIIASQPAWSSDGLWIAFRSNRMTEQGDIWLIQPDGADAQPILKTGMNEGDPEWLP